MDFKIPDEHRKAFGRLAGMSTEAFEAIVSALGIARPCLRLTDLRDRVQAAILSAVPGESCLAEAIIALAVTSSRWEFNSEVSEKDLLQSLATAVAKEENLDPQDTQRLRDRLVDISRLPVIRVSTKSTTLRVAHDRVFNSSKIVTDLRPVFGEPVSSGELAFLVIHHLHITAMRNGETEEVYFSMDDKDLDMLGEAVERARTKAGVLRSALRAHQLKEIDGGTQ